MTADPSPDPVRPEAGARPSRAWLTPRREALLALVLCVGWDLALSRGETALRFPDAMEYATIARSLAAGNGYRTRTLWLSRLSVPAADPAEWTERGAPDVRRPPLHVFFLAAVFRTLGPSDAAAAYSTALIGSAAAWLFFILTRKRFGSGAAWLCLGIFLFDPGRIFYGPTGLTEPLFTLLLIPFGFLLISASRFRDFALLGVLLGLLAWTRHNAFLLFPAAAGAIIAIRRPIPWRGLGILLLVFAPFFLAPAVRNHALIGSFDPVGMPGWVAANDTGIYPEHAAERSLERPPSLATLLTSRPEGVLAKWRRNLPRNAKAAVTAPSPFLWLLVLLGAVWWRRMGGLRVLLGFCLLAGVLSIAAFSLGEFEGPRFYAPYTPLWLVIAGFGIREWLGSDQAGTKPRLGVTTVTVGFLCLLALHPGWKLAWPRLFQPVPGDAQALARFLRSAKWDGRAFLSDMPWAVGWYGDRTAYWLPLRPNDVSRIPGDADVQVILLTSGATAQYSELAPEWEPIYRGGPMPGFTRTGGTPGLPGVILLVRPPPGGTNIERNPD